MYQDIFGTYEVIPRYICGTYVQARVKLSLSEVHDPSARIMLRGRTESKFIRLNVTSPT